MHDWLSGSGTGVRVSPRVHRSWPAIHVLLLALKMATQYVGVWPLSRYFFMRSGEAHYTALLMSTGLTFGTISALFGLQNKIITQPCR